VGTTVEVFTRLGRTVETLIARISLPSLTRVSLILVALMTAPFSVHVPMIIAVSLATVRYVYLTELTITRFGLRIVSVKTVRTSQQCNILTVVDDW